ncbi:MAG TPA: hypothetical protein VND19_15315 [Acetobacteraceae bacterium]|nr:hypothetical protein [Acetobacteraceae bacterium]
MLDGCADDPLAHRLGKTLQAPGRATAHLPAGRAGQAHAEPFSRQQGQAILRRKPIIHEIDDEGGNSRAMLPAALNAIESRSELAGVRPELGRRQDRVPRPD